jgi:hypothetical protein
MDHYNRLYQPSNPAPTLRRTSLVQEAANFAAYDAYGDALRRYGRTDQRTLDAHADWVRIATGTSR